MIVKNTRFMGDFIGDQNKNYAYATHLMFPTIRM